MRVLPSELLEVISLTPAMRPSERSSRVATEDAIGFCDAPGSEALTMITGKSTCGSRGDWQHTETQYAAQGNGDRQ